MRRRDSWKGSGVGVGLATDHVGLGWSWDAGVTGPEVGMAGWVDGGAGGGSGLDVAGAGAQAAEMSPNARRNASIHRFIAPYLPVRE